MARKRRYYPKREAELKGSGYDSLLEKRLHETKLSDCKYHPRDYQVDYSVTHSYEVDFIYEKNGITYFIETKGRFTDSAEARKYTFIREYLPPNCELVFVWDRVNTAFPFSRRRKDGTRMNNEEWADKHGFRHWDQHTFTLDLL